MSRVLVPFKCDGSGRTHHEYKTTRLLEMDRKNRQVNVSGTTEGGAGRNILSARLVTTGPSSAEQDKSYIKQDDEGEQQNLKMDIIICLHQ